MFRLTKSLFEVKRIRLILKQSNDLFAVVINSVSRAFYFFFWLFDNVYISLKLTNTGTPSSHEFFRILSRRFQLVGQLLFLIYCFKTLRRTQTDESDLKVAALNRMTVKQM